MARMAQRRASLTSGREAWCPTSTCSSRECGFIAGRPPLSSWNRGREAWCPASTWNLRQRAFCTGQQP